MVTKFLIYTVCSSLIGVFAALEKPIYDDYYWRQYHGELPYDALTGGIQSGAQRTYIGQTVNGDHSIVGEIRQDTKELYYELGGYNLANKANVQILCTKHPERYHWVKTSIENMKTLNRDHLVVGGYEAIHLYIGRAQIGDEKPIGKITLDNPSLTHAALWIAHKGRNPHFYDNFEVLMYNPKAFHKIDTVTKVLNINLINY